MDFKTTQLKFHTTKHTKPSKNSESILSIGQNAFRFAKLFGYFPFSFESEKVESDKKFVKLKSLHVLFHVIILSIQILWIVKFFASMSHYTAKDQRVVTDEIGIVVCGAVFNVIMASIRFQKLWRKQKFEYFWKNFTTYHEKLSTLLAEDENLLTKFSESTKSIRKQLNFRLLLFSAIILIGLTVDFYGIIKYSGTDSYYENALNLLQYMLWDLLSLSHTANSMTIIFFILIFACYFETLNNAMQFVDFSNAKNRIFNIHSADKSIMNHLNDAFVNTVLDLYSDLESIVEQFNDYNYIEYGQEIFLCAMQVLMSIYYVVTDLETLNSPFAVYYIASGSLNAKICWDYCVRGSEMSYASVGIIKRLESLAIRNISQDTGHKVRKS